MLRLRRLDTLGVAIHIVLLSSGRCGRRLARRMPVQCCRRLMLWRFHMIVVVAAMQATSRRRCRCCCRIVAAAAVAVAVAAGAVVGRRWLQCRISRSTGR